MPHHGVTHPQGAVSAPYRVDIDTDLPDAASARWPHAISGLATRVVLHSLRDDAVIVAGHAEVVRAVLRDLERRGADLSLDTLTAPTPDTLHAHLVRTRPRRRGL